MRHRWTSTFSGSGRALVLFLAAWSFLNLLPFLPALASPLPRSPYFPLNVEVLVLVTAVVYTAGTRWESLARAAAGAGLALLVMYETYDAAVYAAFGRSGILYEDIRFVDNLGYLAFNMMSWRGAAGVALALVGAVALGWLARRALRALSRTGRLAGCRSLLLAAHLVAWPLVTAIGPALEMGPVNITYQTSNERSRVRTTVASAAANLQASLRLRSMIDSLATAPVDTTYTAYDTLTLAQRPPIYLFAVESYGSVLNARRGLRGPYRNLMRRTQETLARSGWHMATARCRVPVRGGRSWLSIASLLTGVRVEHQLLYSQFQSEAADSTGQVPHFVDFLDGQGYRTVALQPFTFERPGLPVQNTYDFDRTMYRADLNYQGPSYGLADAPDQYSLHFTHERVLTGRRDPFFLFFETVDSHSLWNYGLPPYPEDWRQFNSEETAVRSPSRKEGVEPPVFLPDSITRPVIYDQAAPHRYLRHIAHDLRVLREYLVEKAPDGSLVVLLGDHQPPLLDAKDMTVPIHIMSTDSTLVELPTEHGFSEGLLLTEKSRTVRQEGLYSFLVRLLAAYDRGGAAADTTELPPLRPRGVSPSLLVR